MSDLTAVLAIVASATVLALPWAVRFRRSRDGRNAQWLPADLRAARLAYSERMFRCTTPVPIVARIDRAYRASDSELILVEFKCRAEHRIHDADVVEMSVQRYVLERAGHFVSRRGYVVIARPDGGGCRALPVELEDSQSVERRAIRLQALRQVTVAPNGSPHPVVCRGCGHAEACPHTAK